jgi:flavin-binding protein dodecin
MSLARWLAKRHLLPRRRLQRQLKDRAGRHLWRKVMSVYRVTEIIGTSPTSWEDAAKEALSVAAGSLRDLRVAEVIKLDISLGEKGQIETYRAKLRVSFKYEQE